MADNTSWFDTDIDVKAEAKSAVARQFGITDEDVERAKEYLYDADAITSEIKLAHQELKDQLANASKYKQTCQRSLANLADAKQKHDTYMHSQEDEIRKQKEDVAKYCKEISYDKERMSQMTTDTLAKMHKIEKQNESIIYELNQFVNEYDKQKNEMFGTQEKFNSVLTQWQSQATEKKRIFDKFVMTTTTKMDEFNASMNESQRLMGVWQDNFLQVSQNVDKQFSAKTQFLQSLHDNYLSNVNNLETLRKKAEQDCEDLGAKQEEAQQALSSLETTCRKYKDAVEESYEETKQAMEDAQSACEASYNVLQDTELDIREKIAELERKLEERKRLDRQLAENFHSAELVAENYETYLHNLQKRFVAEIQQHSAIYESTLSQATNSAVKFDSLDTSNGLENIYEQLVDSNTRFAQGQTGKVQYESVGRNQQKAGANRQAPKQPNPYGQPDVNMSNQYNAFHEGYPEDVNNYDTNYNNNGFDNYNYTGEDNYDTPTGFLDEGQMDNMMEPSYQQQPQPQSNPRTAQSFEEMTSINPYGKNEKPKKQKQDDFMDSLNSLDTDYIMSDFQSTATQDFTQPQDNLYNPNYQDDYIYDDNVETGYLLEDENNQYVGMNNYGMAMETGPIGDPNQQIYEGDEMLSGFDVPYQEPQTQEPEKKKSGFLGRFRK